MVAANSMPAMIKTTLSARSRNTVPPCGPVLAHKSKSREIPCRCAPPKDVITLATSRGARLGSGWSSSIGGGKPDTEHPENQQNQRKYAEKNIEGGAEYGGGQVLADPQR